MGWTYFAKRSDAPRGEEAENAYLARNYAMDGQSITASRVCRSHAGNSAVWYAVLETRRYGKAYEQDRANLAPEPICLALVVLIDRQGSWGEKAMDETMGPNESRFPFDFLPMLTACDTIETLTGWNMDYAREWRRRCGRDEPKGQAALPLMRAEG